jgi:hypothetical protein
VPKAIMEVLYSTEPMPAAQVGPQSNELTGGPSLVSSELSFIGGVHIGARALFALILVWFGFIARLSQGGGGGVISSFK